MCFLRKPLLTKKIEMYPSVYRVQHPQNSTFAINSPTKISHVRIIKSKYIKFFLARAKCDRWQITNKKGAM